MAAASDFNVAHPPRPQRRPPRKTLVVIALISTLILTFILIQRGQHGSFTDVFHFKPASWTTPHEEAPIKPDSAVSGERLKLHPEDHTFRDATTIKQHWRVTTGLRRPDGVLKRVYLVNGEFPGPTLECRSGDKLIVNVENGLESEGISIHWHGLSMRGANGMDGAVGITQDVIKPGRSFTYQFTIEPEQSGTFWWHGHESVQRADGLYGGLVVHKPSTEGDANSLADETLLLVGDWFHRTAAEALQSYMHPGAFGLETIPDSVLLNGAGAFNCADAVPARPLDCTQVEKSSLPTLRLSPKKRSILRVVNVGAYAGVKLAAPGSVFTPLTVDAGHKIDGSMSKAVGFLQPGERVDMLIELDPVAAHYQSQMQITLDDEQFKYDNLALSLTHSFPLQWNGRVKRRDISAKRASKVFDIQTATSSEDQTELLPEKADHTIVLYALTQKLARMENEPHGFINHTTWLPQKPALHSLSRSKWDQNQFIPHIPFDQDAPKWVDIVLNNLDEDWHPFHLHGNNFWVITKYSSTFNWGSYNPFEDAKPPGGDYDLKGAVKKDTVYVPRRGYAVLRFRADNPGLWAFHCHVLWHEASGMAMALDVRY